MPAVTHPIYEVTNRIFAVNYNQFIFSGVGKTLSQMLVCFFTVCSFIFYNLCAWQYPAGGKQGHCGGFRVLIKRVAARLTGKPAASY